MIKNNRLIALFCLFICQCACGTLSSVETTEAETHKTTITTQTEVKEKLPPSLEEELKRAEQGGDSRFYQEFINMLFYLVGIIAFIVFFMWILKRMLTTRMQQVNETSSIKILERRSLTPKTTVYILTFFGKTVAITESTNGVTLLSEETINKEPQQKSREFK
ncbi:MAG: hypothetical protein K940chlam7_00189 [Chlamydiae bacterium]|nr:hypothetical protein [Chlamydiota bacterium]